MPTQIQTQETIMKICFTGYNLTPQYLRTDKSTRILIDVSNDQLENIQDILLGRWSDGSYRITIEPDIEELDEIDDIPMPHMK